MSIFRQILDVLQQVRQRITQGDSAVVAAIEANGELIKVSNAKLDAIIALLETPVSTNVADFAPTVDPPVNQ